MSENRVNPWIVAVISIPVLLMVILDTTVVDVIIPHMMAALSVDYYDIQWVIIAYMVSAAVVMPAFDWLSSRFSYKTLFITGTLLFVCSSIACGQARTIEVMIASRTLQGAGEGIVVPAVTSMVFLSFPPERRGFAMGLVGLGATMGPALGPTVGGYVTQHISWRWAFYINVPIGFTLALAAFLFLPPFSLEKKKAKFDFLGFLFCTTFLSTLLIALSKGQEKQWLSSDFILYMFITSAVSFVLFIITELKSSHPFVQIRIFRYRGFTVTMFIRIVFGGALYGSFLLVPIYCEKLRMYPTFLTGLLILPGAIANGLGTVVAGRLVDRMDPRKILLFALIAMFFGLWHMHLLDPYTPKEKVAEILFFFFLFIGFTFTPLNYISLTSIPREYTDTGASMIHVIRFISGSMGTALATNRFEYMHGYHFTGMSSYLNYGNLVLKQATAKLSAYLFNKAQIISQINKKMLAALKMVIDVRSHIYAFQDCMIIFALACLLAASLVFLLPNINLKGEEER